MKLRAQRQEWHDHVNNLILHEHGSARLEIYPEPIGERKVRAFFNALWVEEDYRRQGIATAIMEKAEQIAKDNGIDAITLFVYDNEAEDYIISHYDKIGYDVVYEGEDYSEMRKILK